MKLHTTMKGEGNPIVFLHTGLQTGTTDYVHQSEYFSKEYQVILPDLRGHGDSLSDDYDDYFNATASDLNETLEHMGIDSASIVGASLGALVAIVFARMFPDKVRSLTVSGVMANKPANWEAMHAREVESQRKLLRDDQAVESFNQLHNTNWRDFIYMVRDKNWYPFKQTADFSDIRSPVLSIVGEGNLHEVESAALYRKKSNTHVTVIPFASHLVHQEQPELYTEVLEQFLQKYAF